MNMSGEAKQRFSAEVVLFEPEIPQNTGNIGRTCVALGCKLHLIEPLGFTLEDRFLKRSGMDYWKELDVRCYKSLTAFFEANREGRYLYFTKFANQFYDQADYSGRVYLFFGQESGGLPDNLTERNPEGCFRLPMLQGTRSLNLSNAVAVVLYEAYRCNQFLGLV